MNTRTNPQACSGAVRVLSWVMAFALVFTLVAAPALTASADPNTVSAELVFSAEGLDISGKVALDVSQVLLGVTASMVAGGETLADAAAYLSTQALVVDGSLVGGAYGVDLPTLAGNLAGSIFAPDSGSAYALDEETYSQIMALLSGEMIQSAPVLTVDTGAVEQAVAVLMEAYSGVSEQIMANLTLEAASTSVVINGQSVPVSEVRCSADGDAAVGIMETLIAPLQGNSDAREALADLINEIAAASGEDLGITGEELVQAIVSELPQQLPEVKEELAAEQFLVIVSACVSDATQMPVRFSLEVQDADESVAINLLMSENMDFFRFEVEEDGQVDSALQFEIQENSASAFACKFAVIEGSIEDSSLTFELDKASQTFELGASAEGDTTSMSGYYSMTDTLFSLTIDKLDGEEFGGTITLNLRSDDTVAMPSFTELTKLTEDEFTAVVQNAMASVEYLSEIFG